jgi:hypothetical protein
MDYAMITQLAGFVCAFYDSAYIIMLIINVLMTDMYVASYNQQCKSYVVYDHLVEAYILCKSRPYWFTTDEEKHSHSFSRTEENA